MDEINNERLLESEADDDIRFSVENGRIKFTPEHQKIYEELMQKYGKIPKGSQPASTKVAAEKSIQSNSPRNTTQAKPTKTSNKPKKGKKANKGYNINKRILILIILYIVCIVLGNLVLPCNRIYAVTTSSSADYQCQILNCGGLEYKFIGTWDFSSVNPKRVKYIGGYEEDDGDVVDHTQQIINLTLITFVFLILLARIHFIYIAETKQKVQDKKV